MKKSMKKRVLLTLGLGFVLILMFYFITGAITKYTGYSVSPSLDEKTDFESCLVNQDIILYINSEDSSKTLKEIKNFDYLTDIKFFNCLKNQEKCISEEITTFPSWVINNNKIERDISVKELSEISGCKF
jgi:hypothetical protein